MLSGDHYPIELFDLCMLAYLWLFSPLLQLMFLYMGF